MNTGIVMEVKEKFVIVMTKNGEFLKAEKQENANIGEEIKYTMYQEKRKKFMIPKFQIAVASILIFFLAFASFFSPFGNQEVYAMITMDINPSLELDVDKNFHVQKIKAYNSDAQSVIETLHKWEGEPLYVVADLIIESSDKKGFLKENGEIVISYNFKDPVESEVLIQNEIKKIKKPKKIEIKTFHVDLVTREEAVKVDISPNKYQIYKDAKKEGINLPEKSLNSTTISDMKKEIEINKQEKKQENKETKNDIKKEINKDANKKASKKTPPTKKQGDKEDEKRAN